MKKQQGFSLIELIIVVVILSLLAVTALPRFLNVTEQAEDAAVEGVAGGFAAAVGLVRAQWEIEGRPSGTSASITMDSTQIQVNEFGFPTSSASGTNLAPESMSASACKAVFDGVMQSPVRSVVSGTDATDVRYYIGVQSGGTTDSGVDYLLCSYHLVATLKLNSSTGLPTGTVDFSVGNSFSYNPATGQIQVYSNNT
ncbi:type II secretion system protein [Psychrobium sp. 1_MG-2023]|uniref:type II secretion system protein n=1 Tax=Psychrobium sp. 1_MG-2023 TaxID=3062624 RepID=UPI00269A5EE4|nr:type II secretion system protein [Psychrobium sp. 1_MG-2023]MDP2560859.1 type II secretion system protein [Psychrobium sp. 1_MG-2023]